MPRALNFQSKICPPEALAARAGRLARPLVFTNGVFDILHRGHVTYLARAKALGASLIVALNSDASAKRLGKGIDRPVNALEDRLDVIAALQSVDLVTWFDDDTPLRLIRALAPDVLAKGGDWKPDQIVGADEVRNRGGSVLAIPIEHERSTTQLLRKIRGTR